MTIDTDALAAQWAEKLERITANFDEGLSERTAAEKWLARELAALVAGVLAEPVWWTCKGLDGNTWAFKGPLTRYTGDLVSVTTGAPVANPYAAQHPAAPEGGTE